MVPRGFLVEFLISLIRVHVASLLYCNYVRMLGELPVSYGTVILSLLVFVKYQLNQFCLLERCPCDGILLMFLDVWNDSQ